MEAVEIELVELRGSARGAARRARATRRTGSASSSRTVFGDRLPQPLDVGLAEHLRRPALVRERGDRPRDRPRDCCDVERVEQRPRSRASDPILVEVGEQLRLGIARDHHQRAVVADRLCLLEQPLGRLGEHVVVGQLDHRAADVLVCVADVDVARARLVSGTGDRAGELGVVDQAVHEQRLPRLDVRPDADDQLGVALEAVHRVHNRESAIKCREGRRPRSRRARRAS